MVEQLPNPNPAISEPSANLSDFLFIIASSNISNAVLHNNFVYS